MNELPIASPPSAPATAARPSTNASPRTIALRDGAPEPIASSFQDALALELELALDSSPPPGLRHRAATANAENSIEPGEDAAPSATAATPLIALPDIHPLPAATTTVWTESTGRASAPRPNARNDIATAPKAKSQAPISTVAADFTPPGTIAPVITGEIAPGFAVRGQERPIAPAAANPALPSRLARATASEIAQNHAARAPQLSSPQTPAAANSAESDKLSLPADGEIHRVFASDAAAAELRTTTPALTSLAATHHSGAAPAEPVQAPVAAIEAQVGARGWDQGLGERVVWMAGQKQQVAELHLNPPELGPLKITLTLNHDQASAQFVSAHAPVREVIEAAMPRLRDMLADSGITLGNTSVGADAFREQPQREPHAYPASSALAAADAGAITLGERLLLRSRGLIDTFV